MAARPENRGLDGEHGAPGRRGRRGRGPATRSAHATQPRPGGGAIRAAGQQQDRGAAHQAQARGQVHPARGESERGHRRRMIREASRDILVPARSSARSLRAVLFDAGNTLVRMNYAAIARQPARLGHPVEAEAVQHAERRARVRFDDGVLARPGTSTESGDARTATAADPRGAGLAEPPTARAMAAWRQTYNPPVGIFDVIDPRANAALALARRRRTVPWVSSPIPTAPCARSSARWGWPAISTSSSTRRGRRGEARRADLLPGVAGAGGRAARGGLRRGSLLGGRAARAGGGTGRPSFWILEATGVGATAQACPGRSPRPPGPRRRCETPQLRRRGPSAPGAWGPVPGPPMTRAGRSGPPLPRGPFAAPHVTQAGRRADSG